MRLGSDSRFGSRVGSRVGSGAGSDDVEVLVQMLVLKFYQDFLLEIFTYKVVKKFFSCTKK